MDYPDYTQVSPNLKHIEHIKTSYSFTERSWPWFPSAQPQAPTGKNASETFTILTKFCKGASPTGEEGVEKVNNVID